MKSKIRAISYYLPEKILTNQELDQEFPEWKIDELTKVTGVEKRHIMAEGETPSDMGVMAAEKLFSEHDIDRTIVDFVIFCTQSNDYITPTTACVIQERLKLNQSVGTFDVNQGCTGFVYSISLAKALIESNQAKNVLVLTAETISKYIHLKDKSSRPLFGDGSAACLVESTESEKGIGDFIFGTNGKGFRNIIIEYGCARNAMPAEPEVITDKYGNTRFNTSFYMNGNSVFLFSIKTGPKLIQDLLEKSKLTMEDIDMVIFHQASKLIMETIVKKAEIPEDKYFTYIKDCGNTVSSSIPIALYHAMKENKVKKGNKLMLVSFGVGYSWAACVLDL